MFSKMLAYLGRVFLSLLRELGELALLLVDCLCWLPRPPYRIRNFFKQLDFIGVRSLFIVTLTGLFTGMVLALQAYYGFRKFGGETLLGGAVALSMTREIGPVLTSLMVAARAGSAMAAELGTMAVTEQVDALLAMAVNPVHYLALPRLLSGLIMVPLLTVVDVFIGILGGYFVGVMLIGINPGTFMQNMMEMVAASDLFNGLFKSMVFGLLLALISCHQGLKAHGGAEGVGLVTTRAVVYSAIAILIGDYMLTALLF
ncbi:MAG: ABC transporter permease [Deltaproteobacteria bacterium]|nr:ABC transporter permease [Deltaproteobacteria bacterium]MBW1951682.1 ABC transporter permease [Deltaproteobacteria bacterium]MBW1987517.1 ABC transporter permease [Deltaproteobacteria bacterium]MBW2134696.1 ABC transporter permease [Deltaproteobacteria bacterium]